MAKKLVQKLVPKKPVKKVIKKPAKSVKKITLKKPVKKVLNKVPTKKAVKKIIKKKVAPIPLSLKRAPKNPIIEPSYYEWESKATFNPAAFEADGKIYIVYRAIGDDDSSALGYAMSPNGINITERWPHAVYSRRGEFVRDYSTQSIDYVSGGGWNGGCEDPRLTLIDDTVYMLYTAFDGWGSVRIALTSIKLDDFKKKKWNWKKSVLISPPGEIHKNWVIFPEKIGGKFAVMHTLSPKIGIEYFDSLDELDGKRFIKSIHQWSPEWRLREKGIRGVGPTPIKTPAGWLILYHKIEEKDPNQYKIFAMILDKKDPTKVLYKSPAPILEPKANYENHGYKWGVVYTCGAAVLKDKLFVYYGGADKVSAVAWVKLNELIEDLKKNKVPKLKISVTKSA